MFYADEFHIQRAAATWILKTRERHRIPLSVMDSLIYDVQSLFDIIVSNLSSQVQDCLQNSDVSQGVVESVGSMFHSYPSVFTGLQTQQQQLSYFRRNFNFVVSVYCNHSLYCVLHNIMNCHVSSRTKDPVKILLGTKKKPQGLGSKRRLIEKEEVFVYVPILQTLQALLTNETILAEVDTLMHIINYLLGNGYL